MNRRRMNPRLRIQAVALLMLLGLGALTFKLWLGASGARAGVDGENSRQFRSDRSHPVDTW